MVGRKTSKKTARNALDSLHATVVAIPLLETMKVSPSAKHRVIIEINLLNAQGRESTKKDVIRLVEAIAGANSVNQKLATDTDQYVFASLTSTQIRALAIKNEQLRGGAELQAMDSSTRRKRPIYKIWPDFEVELLLNESVSTVKADAARAAFAAGGRGIVWAVIDSGIAGDHPHFSLRGNLKLLEPLSHWDYSGDVPKEIRPEDLTDDHGHGTHVAGIIAGERIANGEAITARTYFRDHRDATVTEKVPIETIRGVAPECQLVSLRVADKLGKVHARSIIAALGYIRRINGDGRLPRIHGVNISLGHPFDPQWFACGQSPLCVEVDRLVRSGTVVVVAAGNGGYGTVQSVRGSQSAGLSATLRDPANARLSITVGATHRDMPHVYGVSYFSSKGPTGDGRQKPDLVAPGEKIVSCDAKWKTSKSEYVEDSGTSMAAPHVSGCIAAFLSIRREFRNQPERVKEIFLETATDLGRERYYQGHGLVDLMRAIQSV